MVGLPFGIFIFFQTHLVTLQLHNSSASFRIPNDAQRMQSRARSGLQNAVLGQARALYCGRGLFEGPGAYLVKSGLGLGLGARAFTK
jgi:hypothetical protein